VAPKEGLAGTPLEMTHAEKFMLIMLSEIYGHLGIDGRECIDATFVRRPTRIRISDGLGRYGSSKI
jgi:hypothetical protein